MTNDAVGIVIYAHNNDGKLAALLSHRTNEDSFARGTQVSSHGKLTLEEYSLPDGQGFRKALLRKVAAELGEKMRTLVAANDDQLVVLTTIKTPEKEIFTYGLLVTDRPAEDLIAMVDIGTNVGGVFLCTDPSTIQLLQKDLHKAQGVPQGEVRMFPDELEAVEKGFEKFKTT